MQNAVDRFSTAAENQTDGYFQLVEGANLDDVSEKLHAKYFGRKLFRQKPLAISFLESGGRQNNNNNGTLSPPPRNQTMGIMQSMDNLNEELANCYT